ncbi:helix-turn-helix transcriptional regulator [Alicyclobacillus fructus]|uniref:helix-turn-helix transcriptional regulator n=1 Tax=Alicyclobacillus fructus TaxID=2816082 RepID=UPI001A8DBD5E|nr:helix-turn-helix transcriptional regulator [Alicyclobacillus fructus]
MRLDAFGRRLRAFRKLKQMTQADLARALGISLATIGGIERGTRQPTPDLASAIASVLCVDEEELYGPSRADGAWGEGAERERDGHPGEEDATPPGCQGAIVH